MHKYDHVGRKIAYGEGSSVFALIAEDKQLRLVRLGDFDTIRYRFNQMACLVGAAAMEKLLPMRTASGSANLGQWTDRSTGKDLGTPEEIFALAAHGPSDDADLVGGLAWFGEWPAGTDTLGGTQHMRISLAEIGNLFYDGISNPTVRAGRQQDRSAVMRVEEALEVVKRKGYAPVDETGLREFMRVYGLARQLMLVHAVSIE